MKPNETEDYIIGSKISEKFRSNAIYKLTNGAYSDMTVMYMLLSDYRYSGAIDIVLDKY